jgi:hypothetical protein
MPTLGVISVIAIAFSIYTALSDLNSKGSELKHPEPTAVSQE